MTLSNEIQEAIKKNMPNMVAGELQEYIKQSEKNKEELKLLRSEVSGLRSDIQALNQRNIDLLSLKYSADNNIARAKELDEEKREMKFVLANAARDAAIVGKKDIFDLAMGLVRNTEFKKTITGMENIPTTMYDYSSGRPTGSSYISTNKNDTITEEAK